MTTTLILPGATSQSLKFKAIDNTTGLAATTLTSATAGLSISYQVGIGAVTAITLSDLAAADSAWSSGGIKHLGGGVYRIDVPNASVPATEGARSDVFGSATAFQILGFCMVGKPVEVVSGSVVAASVAGAVASVTGAVGSVAAGVTLANDAITAAALAASATAEIAAALPTAAGIADAVLDEDLDGHTTANTAGAALRRVGRGAITTVSPVTQAGDIDEVIEGMEYSSTTGNLIAWTQSSAASWPVLTGCVITFSALARNGATFSKAGAVVTATGGSKQVSLTLTSANSSAIVASAVGVWTFGVWATGGAAGDGTLLVMGAFPAKAVPQP